MVAVVAVVGDEQGGPVGEGPDGAAAVLHLPLSDVAVLAQSPFSTTGCATWRWASQLEIVELECCEAMGATMVEVDMAARTRCGWRQRWARKVVSVYAGYPDISLTVTPDIKHAGRSSLVFVDLSGGHARLGGSALAQTFKQLGDVTPDCDTALLKRAFRATQRLLREGVLVGLTSPNDSRLLCISLLEKNP